jgi:Putative beta-barrel porin 2
MIPICSASSPNLCAIGARRLVCPAGQYRPRRGQPGLGTVRRPNVAQLPALDGVLIDANLAWRASARTTFLLTAQSTFIDSITVGANSGLARSWDLRCAMLAPADRQRRRSLYLDALRGCRLDRARTRG